MTAVDPPLWVRPFSDDQTSSPCLILSWEDDSLTITKRVSEVPNPWELEIREPVRAWGECQRLEVLEARILGAREAFFVPEPLAPHGRLLESLDAVGERESIFILLMSFA